MRQRQAGRSCGNVMRNGGSVATKLLRAWSGRLKADRYQAADLTVGRVC